MNADGSYSDYLPLMSLHITHYEVRLLKTLLKYLSFNRSYKNKICIMAVESYLRLKLTSFLFMYIFWNCILHKWKFNCWKFCINIFIRAKVVKKKLCFVLEWNTMDLWLYKKRIILIFYENMVLIGELYLHTKFVH